MNSNKQQMQDQAIAAWFPEKKGTIVVGTGGGKTKIGLMAINSVYTPDLRVLIIVPTTNLRDNEWVNEIDKWFPYLKGKVDIECIQTVHKWNKVYLEDEYLYDLIIVDEVHTTLSPMYRTIYSRNFSKQWLGLTATLPHIDEYKAFLLSVCPVVYSVTMEESVDLNLISPYEVYNIAVDFNKHERAKYKLYTNMYTRSLMTLSREKPNAFEAALRYKSTPGHPLQKVATQFWTGMTLRKWICYKAESKLGTCLELISSIPKNKWIVFCQHTDFADELADSLRNLGIFAVSYHSKIKTKQKEAVLEAAKSKYCKVICSAQALNTGYNLPAIDAAICTASTSTELTFIQQLGRGTRLNDNKETKTALYINLYVSKTQEEKWTENKNFSDTPIESFKVRDFIKMYTNAKPKEI